MKASFRVLACVSVGTVFLALTALALVSHRNTGGLMTTADRVANSHAVLERTERVLSLLRDAETGERGYIIPARRATWSPARPGSTGSTRPWPSWTG